MLAEAIALPLVTSICYQHFVNKDAIWVIDNESAAAAAIRGTSAEADVNQLSQTAHLLWMSCSISSNKINSLRTSDNSI